MDVVRVRHRADDRQPVGNPGDPRQVLADGKSRHGRLDGAELAADFQRRLRLGIERLVLRRGPVQI
jgi:hypothetical protein